MLTSFKCLDCARPMFSMARTPTRKIVHAHYLAKVRLVLRPFTTFWKIQLRLELYALHLKCASWHRAEYAMLTQQLAPALRCRQPAEGKAAPEALHQLLEAQRCRAGFLHLPGFL